MRSLRLRTALIGTGVMLTLGASGTTASAASAHLVAAGKGRAAAAAGGGGVLRGTWGTAEEVPGTAALNRFGNAAVNSVSCASAGNCSAGGYYAGRSGRQAFVVSETNSTWGRAEKVPGTATLNTGGGTGGNAQVFSVSCGAAGNCGAGGSYATGALRYQAFVVSQT